MARIIITAAILACAAATHASAEPLGRAVSAENLALMNLTPTTVVARDIPTRDFEGDKTPTSFRYLLPAPGMGAVVGYRTNSDAHPIQRYEVNEATAEGFSQPSSSVGAALAYRF